MQSFITTKLIRINIKNIIATDEKEIEDYTNLGHKTFITS